MTDLSGQAIQAAAGAQRAGFTKSTKDDAGFAADDAGQNIFVPADRATLKKLAEARRLLDEGRVGEAVRNLGAILEEPEDHFLQADKKSSVRHGLRAEAQRLIGQMPREGRELYELQYGARARQMLDEALAAGDVARIAEVARRFFHTRSGYQATFLLARALFRARAAFGRGTGVAAIAGVGAGGRAVRAQLVADRRGLLAPGRHAREGTGDPDGLARAPSDAPRGGWRAGGPDLHRQREGGRVARGADRTAAGGRPRGGGRLADVPRRRCPERAGRRQCAVVEHALAQSPRPTIRWRPARSRNPRRSMPSKGVRSFPRCTPWPSATCC